MNSNSTSCNNASAFGICWKWELRNSRALSWLMELKATKALRLQVWSFSSARKLSKSSGASGISCSKCWYTEAMA